MLLWTNDETLSLNETVASCLFDRSKMTVFILFLLKLHPTSLRIP